MARDNEEASEGHNSSGEQLRLFIEHVENLNEEKKGLSDDISSVFAEAKATGFDVKIMREIIKLRAMNPDDRKARHALIETYAENIGMDLL